MTNDTDLQLVVARRSAVRGVALLATRTGATLLCTLAGSVVLMRLLGPQEFGVFAVLQFALTFLQFFGEVGLGGAVIQSRDVPSERELRSVFTVQLLLATGLVAIAWLAAPGLTVIWPELPASSTALLRAMSLSFLVTTLRVVPSILLERKLRFGIIATADVVQVCAFYLTACTLAVGPFRTWTWPAAVLAQALAGTTVMCAAQSWRPGLALDGDALRRLLRFGLPFQLKNFIGFANGAVTPVYAGAVLGPTAVGLIGWAQQLAYLPLKVVEIVARVSFPLLSRMQDDRGALARALERSIQLCAAAAFFAAALLLTIGRNVTVVVFSDKWLGGLVALYAFSAALLIGFMSPVVGAVLDAVGRPGIIARLATAWTALNWLVVPFTTLRWGFNGFVLGYCVHIVIGNLALLLVLPRVIPEARILRSLAAPGAGAVLVAVLGWFVLRPWATTPVRLCIGISIAFAVHVVSFALVDPTALGVARRLFARIEPSGGPSAM